MKGVVAAAVAIAAGTVLATPATADPGSQPVPNMADNAVLGQPCYSNTGRYIFGWDANGKVLRCRSGVWANAGTLLGVRQIGAKCVAEVHTAFPDDTGGPVAAQSPDGVALFCAYPTDSWEPNRS